VDIIAMYNDELAKTSKVVGNVSRGQLSRTTPCAGFDVRALINHMCLGNNYLAQGGGADGPDYGFDFGDDHVAAFERSRAAVAAKFAEPGVLEAEVPFPGGMVVPGAVALAVGLADAVVHRWDLARATDQDADIDPGVAAVVLERLAPVVPDALRAASPDEATASIPFGPAIEVAEDASPVEKLLAFTGRRP